MRRLPLVLLASLLPACPDGTGGTDPGSTGDASTAAAPTSGDASTTDSGTTGEPAWCFGWQGAEGTPYLELRGRDGAPLTDGGEIQIECGGQGSFMFGLYPVFGGFTPPGEFITFDVLVDVAGHNTNPDGHFYSIEESTYYVGCEQILGGILGVVPVIPPDNEPAVTKLDALPADFHVVMHTPKGDVVVDLELTLVARDDGSWGFCGNG